MRGLAISYKGFPGFVMEVAGGGFRLARKRLAESLSTVSADADFSPCNGGFRLHPSTRKSPLVRSVKCTGALRKVLECTFESGWVDSSKCTGALFLRHCGTVAISFSRTESSVAGTRIFRNLRRSLLCSAGYFGIIFSTKIWKEILPLKWGADSIR